MSEAVRQILEAVRPLLTGAGRAVVAIDGRCASGKTTLAAALQAETGCNLLHLDDFYLPMDQRPADWTRRSGGNIDLVRFRKEALEPARAGQPVLYRAYRCHPGAFEPPVLLQPTPLTVVEGSYSLHPALEDCYDLRVFLTISPEEQRRRLLRRNPERYGAFVSTWIPLEEQYFTRENPRGRAQLCLCTDNPETKEDLCNETP